MTGMKLKKSWYGYEYEHPWNTLRPGQMFIAHIYTQRDEVRFVDLENAVIELLGFMEISLAMILASCWKYCYS